MAALHGGDDLADRHDAADGVVLERHAELVLERGHELEQVERVGAELLEVGVLGELHALAELQRVVDDLDDLCERGLMIHGVSFRRGLPRDSTRPGTRRRARP